MKGIESAFVGVLGKDPELKQAKNGQPYANFSCAVANEAGESQWINVICFGSIAEKLAEDAHKGDRAYVEGSLTLAKWENSEGEARSGLAVSAWKAERLGNIGRNRVEDKDVRVVDTLGGAQKVNAIIKDKPSFPIALPAVKKPKGGFGLFRKAKKATPANPPKMHERPFDDELSF